MIDLRGAVKERWERRNAHVTRTADDRGSGAILLEVARTLPQPFSWSRLVVEACKAHPERFSLVGYLGVPDSNLINSYLCGYKGLVRRGKLIRVRSRVYRVVGEGP